MKPERAQELYSDYAEGALTPALRQALEQHFEADPAAQADYARFSQIFSLLEQPAGQEMDTPLGFRARILEQAAEQQARRETAFSHRAAGLFGGWLLPPAHRRATGGVLAALAVVVLAGVLFTNQTHTTTAGETSGFGLSPTPVLAAGIVQSVEMESGTTNHLFHLHLPSGVASATVNAYVVTATEQITDSTHLSDAIPAVTAHHLNSNQSLQIPIAPAQTPPVGSTLNLLAQYQPDAPGQPAGAEAVFTPFGAADPAAPAPVNAGFLDAMQAVASHYGVTVMVDVGSTPTQPVSADFTGSDPTGPLTHMAGGAGYAVQKTANGSYFVYRPS